jgi:hypothetical protein
MHLCSSLQNASSLKTRASLADDDEVEVFHLDSTGSFFIGQLTQDYLAPRSYSALAGDANTLQPVIQASAGQASISLRPVRWKLVR